MHKRGIFSFPVIVLGILLILAIISGIYLIFDMGLGAKLGLDQHSQLKLPSSQTNVPLCKESDWSYYLTPSDCPSTGFQTKKYSLIGQCDGGIQHKNSERIRCNDNLPICSSFDYSEWDNCSQSGTQSRIITSSSPSGCSGGNPITVQSCTYIPQCTENDWSALDYPEICPGSGEQERNWTKLGNCQEGITHPVTETIQCDYNVPSCSSFNYSSWGSCSQSGTQSRIITSSSPSGCSGGNPITVQSCTYIPQCTENDWSSSLNPSTCPSSRVQTKTWTKIGNCQNGISHIATEGTSCDYNIPTCNSFNYSSWGSCSQSGTQSRSITSSNPSGCSGGNPLTVQSCTYIPQCTENDWSSSLNPSTCPSSRVQTKTWTKIGNCQNGISHPVSESFNCTYYNARVYLIDPIETPELVNVELTDLDGSGYLKGKYVDVGNVLYSGDIIPTPRVKNYSLMFFYTPVEFSNDITPNGTLGFWGYDDLSDSGHRFDQVQTYYGYTEAAKYFVNMFGFQPKKPVTIMLYDRKLNFGGAGGYFGNYIVKGSMPSLGKIRGDIRGEVHEYTHLVQTDFTNLPYNTPDERGLVESFPKYFECAFTNTTTDRFMYNTETGGIKNFSNFRAWNYTRTSGQEIAFVLCSTWVELWGEIGKDVADNLVYKTMTKYAAYKSCAANDALKATLQADQELYGGVNKGKIIEVFNRHNIYENMCYVIR